MPQTLSCPNCGSPLPYDPNAPAVVCHYCKRHVVLGDRAAASAPKRATPQQHERRSSNEQRSSKSSRRSPKGGLAPSSRRLLAAVLGVLGLVLVIGVVGYTRWNKGTTAEEEPPAETTLRKIELGASREELTQLLGKAPDATNRITRDFKTGIVRRAELQWDKADGDRAPKVTLFFRHGSFDSKAALARLRTIAPNRLELQAATSHRLFVGDSVLDISSDSLSVWHWTSVHPAGLDRAACGERRAAFWAAARFAVLDGPSLRPEEVEIVNGPPFRTATRLDLGLTVEQVSGEIGKAFPAGRCVTQVGVACHVDVDHPFVSEVRWRWPNAVKGRVREVTFTFRRQVDAAKSQRAIAGCLQAALGPGEESVIDYVKGTRSWTWRIGKQGDTATLSGDSLKLSEPKDAKLDAPATWPDRFADVVGALDRCAL